MNGLKYILQVKNESCIKTRRCRVRKNYFVIWTLRCANEDRREDYGHGGNAYADNILFVISITIMVNFV